MMPRKAVCKAPCQARLSDTLTETQTETNGKWQCHPGAFGYVKSLGLDRVTTHKPSISKFMQRHVIHRVFTTTSALVSAQWSARYCETMWGITRLQSNCNNRHKKLRSPALYSSHRLALPNTFNIPCFFPLKYKPHILYIIADHLPS